MDSITPMYFTAFRMLIASVAILILLTFMRIFGQRGDQETACTQTEQAGHTEQNGHDDQESPAVSDKRTLRIGSLVCGIAVFFAYNLQQFGLVSTDAGKSAFITALYIVLVPILGIFLKHSTTFFTWVAAAVGVLGLYFLCITEGFTIVRGDTLLMIGAFFWAAHILCIAHFAPKVNVLELNAYQFLIAGLITLGCAMLTEDFSFAGALAAAPAILYTGIFSTAIAFSFQAYGQKYLSPTVASIILSTEALFAAIFGWLFLHEVLTFRESIGCILMFAAVILAQIPSKKRSSANASQQHI